MSEINNEQMKGLAEGKVGELMKERLTHVKKSNNEENNSFVFFEKSTLNILLDHLLTGEKQSSYVTRNDEYWRSIVAKLDAMIENNEKEFEDILNHLKKLS